jgi:hypothetical protein
MSKIPKEHQKNIFDSIFANIPLYGVKMWILTEKLSIRRVGTIVAISTTI